MPLVGPRALSATRGQKQKVGILLSSLLCSFDITHWSQKGPILREELKSKIQDKDALFCLLTDKIDAEVLDCAQRLKVIGSMAVGYDHLELPKIKAKGIRVGYTPDVLTQATAELTVALLLATSRRLFEASNQLKKSVITPLNVLSFAV